MTDVEVKYPTVSQCDGTGAKGNPPNGYSETLFCWSTCQPGVLNQVCPEICRVLGTQFLVARRGLNVVKQSVPSPHTVFHRLALAPAQLVWAELIYVGRR